MSGIDMRDEWAKMDNDAIANLEIEKGVMQARIYELESDNARMKAALENIINWEHMCEDGMSIDDVFINIDRTAREGLGK